jgi:hypothetical protein
MVIPTPAPFVDSNTSIPPTTVEQAAYDLRTAIERQVSLMSFGADPTGTRDNSAAFSAAFKSLGAGGGVLRIPVGTYLITTVVGVPPKVTLYFEDSVVAIANGATLNIAGDVLASEREIFSFVVAPSTTPVQFYGGPQRLVSAAWFGADSTGVVDSTNALTQCFKSAIGTTPIYTKSDGAIDSVPWLHLPTGVYLISGTLPMPYNLMGENSILNLSASSTVDFFAPTALFEAHHKGITFWGGRNAYNLEGAHISANFWAEDMKFYSQTGACLKTDDTCDNAVFHLDNCFVSNSSNPGSNLVNLQSGYVYLSNWGGQHGGNTIFYNNGAVLDLEHMDLAPNTSGGYWIDVENGSIRATAVRFGGEATNKTVVKWNAPLTPSQLDPPTNVIIDNFLVVEDCEIYSDSSTAPVFAFYTLPLRVLFAGNTGMDFGGIYFDSGIPLNQREQINSLFLKEYQLNNKNVVRSSSDPEIADRLFSAPLLQRAILQNADQVYCIGAGTAPAGYTQAASTVGVSIATPNDMFGVKGLCIKCTRLNNVADIRFNGALASVDGIVPAGPYSLLVDFPANDQALTISVGVGGLVTNVLVPAGRSTLSLPFYKSFTDPPVWVAGTTYNTLGARVLSTDRTSIFQVITAGVAANSGNGPYGPNATNPGYTVKDGTVVWEWISSLTISFYIAFPLVNQTMTVSRLTVVKNHAATGQPNNITWDTAYPSAGNWFVGDIVYNVAPAASANIGWVCTTAGSPGTWKPFGTIGG